MNTLQIYFDSVRVVCPDVWEDITSKVTAKNPPYTLVRESGVGALQFSFALYSGGKKPNPSADQLMAMVEEFGESRGFTFLSEKEISSERIIYASASYKARGDFVRIWHISDGFNFGRITFLCDWQKKIKALIELQEARDIIKSIEFPSVPTPT